MRGEADIISEYEAMEILSCYGELNGTESVEAQQGCMDLSGIDYSRNGCLFSGLQVLIRKLRRPRICNAEYKYSRGDNTCFIQMGIHDGVRVFLAPDDVDFARD
jgi:hypothetical protein